MKVALDAAGEEPGLDVVVEGAVTAWRKSVLSGDPIHPVLYGQEGELRRALQEYGSATDSIEIVDAPDIISMHDNPSEVLLTKKSSSIVKAVKDLEAGKVSSFVSMGNTAVSVGACRTILERMRWISKPALGVPLPRENSMGFMIDVGATADPKPNHLVQFAAMGAAFVEHVYNQKSPRIALLNIGSESNKGNELSRDTYRQLLRSQLNFVGNIEGNDIFKNHADVIVTTGFVGNILLKFIESIPSLILKRVSNEPWSGSLAGCFDDLDYRHWGGAVLLGVNKTVVIGHGHSQSQAVANAIQWSQKMVNSNLSVNLRDRVFRARRALWLSNPFSRGENVEDDG